MKRAWIPLTLESGINVTPLPAIKFHWEDKHKNILATPTPPKKKNTIDVITNNIVTNNNRKLSHS